MKSETQNRVMYIAPYTPKRDCAKCKSTCGEINLCFRCAHVRYGENYFNIELYSITMRNYITVGNPILAGCMTRLTAHHALLFIEEKRIECEEFDRMCAEFDENNY